MEMIRKCGISSSPTRTPLTHHHGLHRMTLGMLLLSPIESDKKPHPRQTLLRQGITSNKAVIGRNTLKNLMSSTTNLFENTSTKADDHHQQVFVFQEQKPIDGDILPPPKSGGSRNHGSRRVRQGTNRPATASTGLRIRFFKRTWRPVLGAIPEENSFYALPHLSLQ
uniref:Uncharacterized protein n=1 Tax=Chenopodium quinoa TaxID=63459 RepID=A0A803MYK8_CHEQI